MAINNRLIHPYSENWKEDFQRISTEIGAALLPLNITIEHIGSTSVPDLAAKPIIDMDLIYKGPATFDDIRSGLENIGYYHNGDQGIPNREVFKRKTNESHPLLDRISHHLYVCDEDSEELQRHLIFRDFLRNHAKARIQYGNLKRQIAEEAKQDRKKYALLKEEKAREFIHQTIEQAKISQASNPNHNA